jgi:2-amino-4-hydroxy-6-hydroxymethyldihydropteridine diphosphokinase
MTNLAYLSFGSNINPRQNIPAALRLLSQHCRVLAVSTVWETAPVGFADQPNFLNGAVIIETSLSATALKSTVLAMIEQALGRQRTVNKNGPRPIDLDIILFNDAVIKEAGQRIPSPELLERDFVAVPLAELAPDYVHPETGQTLAEIADQFQLNRGQVFKQIMLDFEDVKPG